MGLLENPILPEQIWNILTTVQRQTLSQTIVQVCQALIKMDKAKMAPDARLSHEQS